MTTIEKNYSDFPNGLRTDQLHIQLESINANLIGVQTIDTNVYIEFLDILNSSQLSDVANVILAHIPDYYVAPTLSETGGGVSLIASDLVLKTISTGSNLILTENSNLLTFDYNIPQIQAPVTPFAKITRDNSVSSPQSTTTSWVNISTNSSYSSSSDFTIVTNGIQINTDGYYMISATANIRQVTLLLTYIVGMAVFLNGVPIKITQNSFNASLTNYITLTVSEPRHLNVNDLLEIRVRSTVSGATVENYSTFEAGEDPPCAELSAMKIA